MPLVSARATKEASDGTLVALAARQHGVMARRQLIAAGVGPGAITERLASGLLVPLRRGVYVVGGSRPSASAQLMAATLAGGGDNVLSHRAATHLHGLLPLSAGAIDITTTRRTRSRPGLRVHHVRSLDPAERGTVDGIPCTSLARTLVDLAAIAPTRTVEQALDQAEVLKVYDGAAIAAALEVPRRGRAKLRAILDRHAPGTTVTRSELEERFLALCRGAELPPAQHNEPIALDGGTSRIADVVWRRERVIVELDGRTFHDTDHAFDDDRARDVDLKVERWSVLRFTWHHVTRRPEWVVRQLRRALGLGAAPPAGGAAGAG